MKNNLLLELLNQKQTNLERNIEDLYDALKLEDKLTKYERKVYLDHAIFLTKALDILNSLENDYLIESYKRSSECTSLSQ